MEPDQDIRCLIDPELVPLLDLVPQFRFGNDALPVIRAKFIERLAAPVPLPIAPVEKVIASQDGPVSVFWFDLDPKGPRRPALLHIHGGGMVIGSTRWLPFGPSSLAAALGVPVASIEYRLAPESSFPTPQEDCYAALLWLANSSAELNVDARRIGVIGESAGGGLAAAIAQMARDRGGPQVAAQVLVYPMLDHRVGSEADPWRNRHTGEFVWTRDDNRFGWDALRGSYRADDSRKGWFSPSLADDFAGLPPAWIGVGSLDLFLDENVDYARRLIDAGVSAELHVYPRAVHGFNILSGTRLAKAFNRDMLEATSRLLHIAARD